MNASEIKVGKKYQVKVGRNEIEVTVMEQTGRGWNVKAPSGNKFPVNNAERFIKCLDVESVPILRPQVSGLKPSQKMSMLDAAVETLKGTSCPMSAKEMIIAMGEANLWKSQTGKTPSNTLSAAIGREISTKENSRFKKAEKGKFALAERA